MKTRKCSICKQDLPEDSNYFASRTSKKGNVTFQGVCKTCQKQYRKDHYHKNKQKYIDKARTYTDSVAKWFQDLKKDLKCKKCGEKRWWVLDFHHRNSTTKDGDVGTMSRNGSKKALLKEIDKCEVLCSNCH